MTLKNQFMFGFCTTLIICTVFMVSVRLLVKCAHFHHLERDHMAIVLRLDTKLAMVEDESKKAGAVTRQQLIYTINEAKAIAGRTDAELFKIEILAFRLAGYGRLFDLAQKDYEDLEKMMLVVESEPGSGVTSDLITKLAVGRAAVVKNSNDYGTLLPQAVSFVKKTVLVLVMLCSVTLFYNLWRLRSRTLLILETTHSVVETVAAGNLVKMVVSGADGKDELGMLLQTLEKMRDNLWDIISGAVNITSGISDASTQLHSASEQIARSSERVASQAVTVAVSSEEMSATSNDIARNCSMAADASLHSTAVANEGVLVVQKSIAGMSSIADRVRQISDSIGTLSTRSAQIGNIVGTIEDIADQTNLLALNAAIEAARAGEQGRGFAVVADEVRTLAVRTTKATSEISDMIKAMQNETTKAVNAMNEGVVEVEKGAETSLKSGKVLEEILKQISNVSANVTQIATAAEEQNATTNEVTLNVHQITNAAKQAACGADETVKAAADLARQSQELQQIVSRFRLC